LQVTFEQPLIGRVDLAKALEQLVADDGRLAGALALCEAWEPGHLGHLITRAEVLAANDAELDVAGVHARAVAIVQRVLRDPDPRQVAERSGATASPAAVIALRQMLSSRAYFHETTDELERRGQRRSL
jgi:hypothetical protein